MDIRYAKPLKETMLYAWHPNNRYITRLDIYFHDLPNARISIWNTYIPKPVLRPEYRTLSGHQGFLMEGLHRMHLSVAIDLPKQMDLILDLPVPSNYDNLGMNHA